LYADYVGACKVTGLSGVKVGVPRQLFPGAQPAVLAAFETAVTTMKGLGAGVKDVIISAYDEYVARAGSNENLVLQLDFKLNLQQYLSQLTKNPNKITTLQSLDTYTMADPREMYPNRNTNTWKAALALNYSISDLKGYKLVQDQEYLARQAIDVTLELNNVDVLVLPSDWAFRIAAIDGHPIITVPLGYYPAGTPTVLTSRGLVARGVNFPFGISFISRKFSEEKLLAYAYAFEQASMAQSQVKPYLLPKTQIAPSTTASPTPMPTMSPSISGAIKTVVTIEQVTYGYMQIYICSHKSLVINARTYDFSLHYLFSYGPSYFSVEYLSHMNNKISFHTENRWHYIC
jgi:amidase